MPLCYAQIAPHTELPITADLILCTYSRATGLSAALESNRPSESWMWLGTNDVALNICSSFSTLKEITQNLILSLIRQFMVSQKLIQCSKFKIRCLEIDTRRPVISSWPQNMRILMDMFLIILNFSHALAATLDSPELGVIVYDWTSFLTTKTLVIHAKIVFRGGLASKLLDIQYFQHYAIFC